VLLATLTAGNQPHGVAVGRNMGGGAASYLFVANQADNSVSIFDCSNAPEAPLEIAGSPISLTSGPCSNPNPHGIGADAKLNQVYVACRNPGESTGYVAVLSGAKGWAPTFIEVGNSPTGIGVNSATGYAYVSNNADNTVSAIDGAKLTVTATISSPSFNGPDRFAVDETSNIVYVSNNTSNTVSAIFAGQNNSVESAAVAGNPQEAVSAPTEMGYLNGTDYVALQDTNQVAEVPAPGAFG
jgi:YVTN family beta-propeller protein